MHILALGGNGFIGAHFVDQALAAGHEVSVLSRRPRPVWEHGRRFRHLPGGFDALAAHPEWLDGVEAVCHGAWSTVPKTAAADPQDDVQINLLGTLKLLELIGAAPSVEHLLFLSSGGAVYGGATGQVAISEDHPLDPIGAYGISKLAAEKYCQMVGTQTGVEVTILRPANPFGPGQSTAGVQGVVSTFLHHARAGSAATIVGDGVIIRDFLDVRDLADLMVRALSSPVPGIYNCGSGVGASLSDVVACVEAATGHPLALTRVPERPFDPRRVVLDITRAQAAFGWAPSASLREGIFAFNDWLDRSGVCLAEAS